MKALYRKYRPTKLSDIIGQSKITETLENAIKNGQISHAYLFTGPRGTGKTSVARIFAHAINNFDYKIEDNYLDIIEIDAASNTGVDNIRDLREKVTIAPSTGEYKVYIIDEVHMLSKSAFNALLKTLEEPPKHVVFIMATTDAHKVPITITSRAQTFNFKLADIDVMADYLKKIAKKEKIDIDDEAINLIAKRGGGSFRDSLSLLDQLATMSEKLTKEKIIEAIGLPEDQIIEELLEAYAAQDQTKITILIKDTIKSGIKPEVLAEEIIKHIIDQPNPALFPLLEKLPNVTNPFPDAKLLLAFLKPTKTRELQVSAEKTTAIKATDTSATVVKKEKVVTKTTEEIPEPTIPAPTKEASGDFDFNNFLNNISSKTLAQTLSRDVDYEFSNETLHLYPRNKFIYGILKKPENEQLLSTSLDGIALKIHAQNDVKKTPINSKISDIMGGEVEEIRENGREDIF